jgi:subtilisin family serine protease
MKGRRNIFPHFLIMILFLMISVPWPATFYAVEAVEIVSGQEGRPVPETTISLFQEDKPVKEEKTDDNGMERIPFEEGDDEIILKSPEKTIESSIDENVAPGEPYAGAAVNIATDSAEWCSYRSGAPTTFTPGDTGRPTYGEDPRDAGRPNGGGYPRDAGSDCEQELELLKNFMASDEGKELTWRATTDATDANDLAKIRNRIRELEKKCPLGSGNPRNVDEPGGTSAPPPVDSIATRPREKDDKDEPGETGEPAVVIYVKAKSSALHQENRTVAGQQIKLFASATVDAALPGQGADKPQTDHDREPIQGITDREGRIVLKVPGMAIGLKSAPDAAGASALEIQVDTTAQGSINAELGISDTQSVVNALPKGLRALLTDVNVIHGKGFLTFTFPSSMSSSVGAILTRVPGVVQIQVNYCREKQQTVNDPLFEGNMAWGQKYDNQWAIKRVGLNNEATSAWNLLGDNPKPVTIAVIDTGLDWNHLDIDWENIWRNPGEVPDNNIDDDDNGHVDDIIGWDFFGNNNKPWDYDGHGTFVTGVIAAARDNKIGIAGINPYARIMVLKALNGFGHTRASYLAKAIVYAVDHGARIINLSADGGKVATIEQEAIKYAVEKGVLIVAAAGNKGVDVGGSGIASLDGVMTVAATGLKDEWQGFSNWGGQIDIAAPGIEILSLRARRTDTMRDIPGVEYMNGANYAGEDKRYYRASGTSFSTPIVSGVASLLMSKNPYLTAKQVETILEMTAKDTELTGFDQFTGYGLVDAVAALGADADFFIQAHISSVEVMQTDKGTAVQIRGTAHANQLSGYEIALGAGEEPEIWKTMVAGSKPVEGGILGTIEAKHFKEALVWMLRLKVIHKNGDTREYRFRLNLFYPPVM